MDTKRFEKAIERLESEMDHSNRRRGRARRFDGLPLVNTEASDGPRVKSLIESYNLAVRRYNAYGGRMGRILQQEIDRNAPQAQPQEGSGLLVLFDLFDEWLRLRSAGRTPLFHDVDPLLHSLERTMRDLVHGAGGINQLRAEIAAERRRGAR